MSNPWCVNDISFQQLKVLLSEEQFLSLNGVEAVACTNTFKECSSNELIRRLQEADRRVLEIRENSYKNKIAIDYSEVVTANSVISTLAKTLDKLVCDLQGLNCDNALQEAYESLLYQVGLIKCDMTSENRCKTLHAIRCAVNSMKQLLSESESSRSIISPQFLDTIKSRTKMTDELDQIAHTIGMFGSDDELSIDDIMEVITSLTTTLKSTNILCPAMY